MLLAALAAAGICACGGSLDLTTSSNDDAGAEANDGGARDGSSCAMDCAPGTTSCRGGGLSTCVVDARGCSEWNAPLACPPTESCVDGQSACACDAGSILIGHVCIAEAPIAPPRAIAPLSTATVTSQLPLLKWSLASGDDGAAVEICRDRACTKSVVSFTATGSSSATPSMLAAGLYYWRLRGTFNGAVGTDTSPTWEFFVGARTAAINTSWGSIVDVNGDGMADVLVGAEQEDTYTGAAYLYLAGSGGVSSAPVTIASPAGAKGMFGCSVASAGDVNGDGYADVIVGALGAKQYLGAAYVYLAGPSGLSSTPIAVGAPSGYSGEFGASVASAGDLNGDGYADVVVGTPGNGDGAFVFLGTASGPSSTAIALVSPTYASDNGHSVASAGDVNGDGFADVIVGAPSTTNGVAFLYFGAASGVSNSPQEIDAPIDSQVDLYFATSAASADDVNGDGYADVVIGSSFGGTYSHPYLYMGGSGGLSTTPIELPSGITGASAGDVNGDGFADVVLGATGLSGVGGYLYFGSAGGLSLTPTTLNASPTSYGSIATGGGDIDGDGFADVLVGMPSNTVGSVSVFLGASSGPATTSSLVITDPGSATGFGVTLQ